MREIIFVLVAVIFLGLTAFCLLPFGNLSSFDLKPVSTEASCIREQTNDAVQHRKELDGATGWLLAIKKKYEHAKTRVSLPTLRLTGRDEKIIDAGYLLTLQFSPSTNEPLGAIEFTVTVADASDAHIVDFRPSLQGGAFISDNVSKQIEKDGKQARLSYSLVGAGRPAFDLTLSKKARIKIEGNYLEDTVVLDFE